MDRKNKLVFFTNLGIDDNNRGCQALTYGSLYFISEYLETDNFEIIEPLYYRRKKRKDIVFNIPFKDSTIKATRRFYWLPNIIISTIISKFIPKLFTIGGFRKDLNRISNVFSVSGGDAFSDIYGTKIFRYMNWVSYVSAIARKKLVLLPQTIGPFKEKNNLDIAKKIITNSEKIFVRDITFTNVLEDLKVDYILSHDVSFFMKAEKLNLNIASNAIGINISGLLYYNIFSGLSGRFPYYKELLIQLIEKFQGLNVPIILIPHTYNFNDPTPYEDDLLAAKDFFNILKDKENISIIDKDYTAPQLKYIISKCDFFIGSRMHANFAAIYSKVPVYGLSYSYKFEGSFNKYNLNNNHSMIIDLKKDMIPQIVSKVINCYEKRNETKSILSKVII